MRLWAVVLVIATIAAACSSDPPTRDGEGLGVTSSGKLSVFDLEVGDCLGDLEGFTDQIEKMPVVPCADPHRIEVMALEDYTVGGEPVDVYPGESELASFADGVCLSAFGEYTGLDYFSLGHRLYFSYLYPTLDSWSDPDRNDRGIVCVVGITGVDLIGSVKGAGNDLPIDPSSTTPPTTDSSTTTSEPG
jgi:Septum formation